MLDVFSADGSHRTLLSKVYTHKELLTLEVISVSYYTYHLCQNYYHYTAHDIIISLCMTKAIKAVYMVTLQQHEAHVRNNKIEALRKAQSAEYKVSHCRRNIMDSYLMSV
jgi:hypothetical protein